MLVGPSPPLSSFFLLVFSYDDSPIPPPHTRQEGAALFCPHGLSFPPFGLIPSYSSPNLSPPGVVSSYFHLCPVKSYERPPVQTLLPPPTNTPFFFCDDKPCLNLFSKFPSPCPQTPPPKSWTPEDHLPTSHEPFPQPLHPTWLTTVRVIILLSFYFSGFPRIGPKPAPPHALVLWPVPPLQS